MVALHDRLEEHFGCRPNVFRLAPENPELAHGLLGFACSAYLNNPLPPLFKERLFVWLSRFCEVRYCAARHIGYLLGLGWPAGDSRCAPQSVDDVLRLLRRPLPGGHAITEHEERCAALACPPGALPAPDSPLEESLFACATHVMLQTPAAPGCQAALEHALGVSRMRHLLALLAYVRTEHFWTSVHPELALDEDVERLLAADPQLRHAVLDVGQASAWAVDKPAGSLGGWAGAQPPSDNDWQQTEQRLLQELDDNRVLRDISTELVGEQDVGALYGKIVGAAARLVGAPIACMQMLRGQQDRNPKVELLGHCGLSEQELAEWQRVGVDPATMAVLARGERVLVQDIERGDVSIGGSHVALYRRAGIRALIATPLHTRYGELVGMISTYSHHPHQPSARVLQLLDILARQAADLIDRARTEEARCASEDRFRRALQMQNVAIIFFDVEGGINEANDTFLAMSGYAREDVDAGRLRWDLLTPQEWMADSLLAIEEFKTKGYTTPYEKQYIRKDGSRWWGLFSATRLSDNEGVEYVIDVTSRKQAEQALRDADQRKDEFLATLAHELRNPLAPISNAVQLLRRPGGRRQADSVMDMMERQVNQIVRLVDDLLEVSRITRGVIELSKGAVNIADVVQAALDTIRPLIVNSRHQLNVELPEEPLVLEADGVRLTQVLANLLNNAVRYTDPGGQIWLSVGREDANLVISVRDSGIGISEEQLAQVFEIFVQGHRAVGRGLGGLGIGLSMVRSLVEMHGGTVDAHSAGPGQGSEFIVRLPLPDLEHEPAHHKLAEPDTSAPLAGLRLLVVDDNRDAADSLGMLLEIDGGVVDIAYDGQSALDVAQAEHPHVVLLDIGMPGMDGYEVAQRLRQDARLQDVRIVALTGWGQEEDRARTRAAGFDYHLTKPVDIRVLEHWLVQP